MYIQKTQNIVFGQGTHLSGFNSKSSTQLVDALKPLLGDSLDVSISAITKGFNRVANIEVKNDKTNSGQRIVVSFVSELKLSIFKGLKAFINEVINTTNQVITKEKDYQLVAEKVNANDALLNLLR